MIRIFLTLIIKTECKCNLEKNIKITFLMLL